MIKHYREKRRAHHYSSDAFLRYAFFFLPKATYGIFASFSIILSESFYFSFASKTMRTLLREEENTITSYTTLCYTGCFGKSGQSLMRMIEQIKITP